jgi:peptidyl-prolyl cis-trans isomerase SurA
MSKRLFLWMTAVMLIGIGMRPPVPWAATVDRIVAVVNGEIITASDLSVAAAQARIGLLGLSSDGTVSRPSPSDRKVLERLIDQKLQLQTAQKKGIVVEPGEVDKAIDDVKQKNGIASNSALEKALKEENSSLGQYREGLKEQIMILKLVNREVKSGVVLSDEEIRAYYERHSDRFVNPTRYHLHEIFIPVAAADAVQTAEQTARNAAEQLRNGAEFQTLVRQYSSGPGVDKNGDLGSLRADQMLPEIRQAIEPLGPGEFSPPVRTASGIHIFRLDEIQPSKPRPIEEVKGEIQELLFQEQSAELYEKWLKDLRAAAQVEIKY